MENEDLNQTLKINKDIIKSLLEGDKKYDAQFEYALAQITQENELEIGICKSGRSADPSGRWRH